MLCPGAGKALGESCGHRITAVGENDGNASAYRNGVVDRRAARDEHVDSLGDEFVDKSRQTCVVAVGEPRHQDKGLALEVSEFRESNPQAFKRAIGLSDIRQPADPRRWGWALRANFFARENCCGEDDALTAGELHLAWTLLVWTASPCAAPMDGTPEAGGWQTYVSAPMRRGTPPESRSLQPDLSASAASCGVRPDCRLALAVTRR